MIQFDKAHIGYSDTLISIDDLYLKSGEVHILVGKNGAGKSTLLKTITKQEKLLKGDILINNTSLNVLRENAIAHHLSFVGSTFPEIDFMSVIDFIGLGRTPHTNALGRHSELDKQKIDDAIAALEIEQLRDKFTSELSDGERQMVSIARAIAQETKIILLDEPTAFLDYANKLKVLNLLKKIAVEMDKCIILSSHDIELSIESECPFLVLSKVNNGLTLLFPPVSKQEVIALAFG